MRLTCCKQQGSGVLFRSQIALIVDALFAGTPLVVLAIGLRSRRGAVLSCRVVSGLIGRRGLRGCLGGFGARFAL